MVSVSPFKENTIAKHLAIGFDLWQMDCLSSSLFTVNFRCITDHMSDHTCNSTPAQLVAEGHEHFADICTCKNTAVNGWHQLRFICTYWSLSVRGEKLSQRCHSVITVRLLKAYVTDCHQTVLSCERKFRHSIPVMLRPDLHNFTDWYVIFENLLQWRLELRQP